MKLRGLADGFAGLAPGAHAATEGVRLVALAGQQAGRGSGAYPGLAHGDHRPGLLDPGSAGLEPVQRDMLGLRCPPGAPLLGRADIDQSGTGGQ
jgi:hypothetical protein